LVVYLLTLKMVFKIMLHISISMFWYLI